MVATLSAPSERLSLLARERLETLLHLSQAFNATLDLDALLPRLLELTLSVTDSEAGSIWLLEAGTLRCTHAAGPAAARLTGLTRSVTEGVLGTAVATRAPVIVADALEDNDYAVYRAAGTGFRTRSAVTMPLVAGGEAVGVIQLVNDTGGKDEFTEDDVAFLECLADDAAAALRNARLFEAERRARSLRAVLEVSHEITSTFDQQRVLLSMVNLARRVVPFERCIVALRVRDELHVTAISGEEQVDRKAAAVRELERLLLWIAHRGEPVFVDDLRADTSAASALRERFPSWLEGSAAAGVLALPVADADGELGWLLFEFRAAGVLDSWMREAAELLANHTALALRNAQLYADVPFISWLEPLAQKRRALLALPASVLLRWSAAIAALVLTLVLVRLPVRIQATQATIFAGVQLPARAGAAGVLEDMLVREGDTVRAGAVVARLRNPALLTRRSEIDGGLRLAERQAQAAHAAGDAGVAASARVRADQLREALALIDVESSTLTVRAPADGVVLTPRLEERVGSFRESGEPVLWIGDPSSAEVRLQVRQHDVAQIRPGDRVRLRVPARPELRFDGRVAAVAPLAETIDGQPHYTVRATVDNHEGVLRPGMQGRARVLAAAQPLGFLIVRRPWRWIRMHLWW